MQDWKELREKNEENIVAVLSQLSAEEQLIFQQVIDFELENRHLHMPPYKEAIRKIVEQNTRS